MGFLTFQLLSVLRPPCLSSPLIEFSQLGQATELSILFGTAESPGSRPWVTPRFGVPQGGLAHVLIGIRLSPDHQHSASQQMFAVFKVGIRHHDSGMWDPFPAFVEPELGGNAT